ncbi:MAG: CoA pyrophosphatase [Lentimicrobiaceae bacterium]|nr:CoA pyrophosphatase [Lentimicrobiaceae bacterium]MCB9023287.1 CoA pyrophosphatase [Lentimicrobiaceae bacterium]MCO5266978.1 CoA pyrophosphatase [Lentimicrobium sp.]
MPSIKFDRFIEKLPSALLSELPGPRAHEILAPSNRNELIKNSKGIDQARKSSVLILLFPDEVREVHTAFIKRVEYEGVHSGQVAFPGGKFEETDSSLENTALRESHEEIGLEEKNIKIVGQLSDLFVPPSNFIIRPFVATTEVKPGFIADKREVAEIFTVPLSYFTNNGVLQEYSIPFRNGNQVKVPGFMFQNHLIWGATAMILSELIYIIKANGLAD